MARRTSKDKRTGRRTSPPPAPQMTPHSGPQGEPRPWLWWVALLCVVLGAAAVRWRLLAVPLERDEGEYAYAGQLILQGIPPYQQVYNMKLPGIYATYAVILALCGQTQSGVHLGLLVVNAATIVLMFFLARRIGDSITGIVTAAAFAVLSLGQPVQGVFANAEHFVILPAVGGLVLLLRAVDTGRPLPLAGSGLLLGLGVVMKQHGAAFVALGGVYLLGALVRQRARDHLHWRRVGTRVAVFALAAAAPFLVTCLVLAIAGVFDKFWFWTVTYARTYVGQIPLDQAYAQFRSRAARIVAAAPLLWLLVAIGLTAITWDRQARRWWLFLVAFALFSLAAICPGFYFRPHYFVLVLPAAALLAGVAISALAHLLARTRSPTLQYAVALVAAAVGLGAALHRQQDVLFLQTPTQVARSTYGLNPFPESLEIARFIRERTTPADRVAVIGSEPQIYFYARRRSATGHVYTYALMEHHDFALEMQREMIREIEAAEPAMLVFVNVWTSWLQRPGSHRLIFDWFREYRRGFALVEVADLRPQGTHYYRGAEVAEVTRPPPYSVEVYRRR